MAQLKHEWYSIYVDTKLIITLRLWIKFSLLVNSHSSHISLWECINWTHKSQLLTNVDIYSHMYNITTVTNFHGVHLNKRRTHVNMFTSCYLYIIR